MGNKYLETKNDTLESSILDVWKDAAKLDEYKTRLGEKKRVAGGDNRRTENKQPKEEGLESSPNAANSQHLCAKNVVHEDWGEGQPVHGMHAIPDSKGDIAWYDVMFEHGIEKGVSINELKVTKAESHHHSEKKKKKMDEEVDLDEGKMAQMHQMMKDKKTPEQIAKAMKLDLKTVKALMDGYNKMVPESFEIGTEKYLKHTVSSTPGQKAWNETVSKKAASMRETLAKVWCNKLSNILAPWLPPIIVIVNNLFSSIFVNSS